MKTTNLNWLAGYRLPFSWSYSRGQVFDRCQRQYYYIYYAPYGGNSPTETFNRALLYRLGKLTSIPALLGTIVHTLARDSLDAQRQGRPWPQATIMATARLLLTKALKNSLKACLKPAAGSRQQILAEHYFKQELDDASVVERLDALTQALLAHPAYIEISKEPDRILLLDEVRRFTILDVPVFCVPDVLFREPEGGYRLIDWKTGSTSGSYLERAKEQLGIYSLFLVKQEHASPQAITCELVDVPGGNSTRWKMTSESLASAEERVVESLVAMRNRLANQALNQAAREDYPLLADAGPANLTCNHCNYRELCFGPAAAPRQA